MTDGWAIAIERRDLGKIQLVCEDDKVFVGPQYGDMHVLPYYNEGEEMTFIGHDFIRGCLCLPKIEFRSDDTAIVIHNERKPN